MKPNGSQAEGVSFVYTQVASKDPDSTVNSARCSRTAQVCFDEGKRQSGFLRTMHFNVLSRQLVPKMVVLLVVSLTNLNKVTKRKPTKLKVWDARMKVSVCICCTQTMTLFGSFSKDTTLEEASGLTQNQDVHASEPRSGLGAAAKAGPVRVPTDFQELQRLISVWGPTDSQSQGLFIPPSWTFT